MTYITLNPIRAVIRHRNADDILATIHEDKLTMNEKLGMLSLYKPQTTKTHLLFEDSHVSDKPQQESNHTEEPTV